MTYKLIRKQCPKCLKAGLNNSMYSEDFASVMDQACTYCGERVYEYIGANDGAHTWDALNRKYPVMVEKECGSWAELQSAEKEYRA